MLTDTRLPILLKTPVLIIALLIAGCYVGPGLLSDSGTDGNSIHAYKLYPGEALPDSQIAKVKLTESYYAYVDGFLVNKMDYEEVHLLPGEHKIRWGRGFAISVLVNPSMYGEGQEEAVVNLKAGHTYELHADRTHGRGYQFYFWIRDAQTGEVVAGAKKP